MPRGNETGTRGPATDSFAAWLRERRRRAFLTQEQLADLAEVSVRTVRNLEAARIARPHPGTMRRLAAALGADDTTLVRFSAESPAQLPPSVPDFVGREDHLRDMDAVLGDVTDNTAVIVLSGTGGVGKTALALQWAHRARARFPDGQIYLDLHGYDVEEPLPVRAALDCLLHTLGLPPRDVPAGPAEKSSVYRSLLADRRMLVVLDNAVSTDQAQPLLPGGSGCAVLVTSRDSLAGLVARFGARRLPVDLLPQRDSVALLRRLIGARVDDEPPAAARLAEQCAHLPLALRVAAELANSRPDCTLADLAAELDDEHGRLDLLTAGGDRRTAVRAVLSWSTRNLPARTAAVFPLLGLHPGRDLDGPAFAALTDTGPAIAGRLLDDLVRAHLVQRTAGGRYRLHDLLRLFAAETVWADPPVVRHAAHARIVDHYLAGTATAMRIAYPGHDDEHSTRSSPYLPRPATPALALRWLDDEHANLMALSAFLAADPRWDDQLVELTRSFWRHLDTQGRLADILDLHTRALRVAHRRGDDAGEAFLRTNLAAVHWNRGLHAEAAEHLRTAQALFAAAGDRAGEARSLTNLSVVSHAVGRFAEAVDLCGRALELYTTAGDLSGQASALANRGYSRQMMGRYDEALDDHRRALDLARRIGHRPLEGTVLVNLGALDRRAGHHDLALERLTEALTIAREFGDRVVEVEALDEIGCVERDLGHLDEAVVHHRLALAQIRSMGVHRLETCLANSLGESLRAAGRAAEALAQHEDALATARLTGDRPQQARALAGAAAALDALGRPAEAEECRRDSRRIHRELDLPEGSNGPSPVGR